MPRVPTRSASDSRAKWCASRRSRARCSKWIASASSASRRSAGDAGRSTTIALPQGGRVGESSGATVAKRQVSHRFGAQIAGVGAAFRARAIDRVEVTPLRLDEPPHSLEDATGREAFPRRHAACRGVRQYLQSARGHQRQRQQVEPVVLEHRLEALGVAVAHEVEIAIRDLESLDVANAPHAEQHPFERAQPAAVGVGPGARRDRRRPPEAPRHVQHVHVREAVEGRREAVEVEPRLEHRHVERLAVVAHQAGRSSDQPVHFVEQRALVLERAKEVLARAEAVRLEIRAADQERIRPRASGQAGGLKVDEEERAGSRGLGRLPAHQCQLRRVCERQPVDVADANGPVPMIGRVEAFDDHARTARRVDHVAIEGIARRRVSRRSCIDRFIPRSRLRSTRPGSLRRCAQDVAQTGFEVRAHAGRRPSSRSRISSATGLASGPVSPTGPTHVGQP